jgi:putative SOS response-associated peptidase YedK
VTCAANATVAPIHDRMPVILDERAAEDWMNPREKNSLSLKNFARACTLRFAGNASGVTAREQRQERGSGTPPGG